MISISVYVGVTIFTLLAGVLCKFDIRYGNSRKISGRQIYLFVMFFVLTFIMAFRSVNVGVDTAPYSRIFGIIHHASSFREAIELAPLSAPIYVGICRILGLFSAEPQILIIFTALFINIGLFVFINRVSSNVVISTFCWIGLTLFYCSMNGSRQSMALVITLNALVYFARDLKSKKGWILMLIAIGIHSTCLIIAVAILGIILTDKIHESRLVLIITVIISALISIVFKGIVRVLLQFFPHYSMYGFGGAQYSIFESNGGGRIVILYIFLLAICVLWTIINKKQNESDSFHSKMLPAVVFGAVFGIFNCRNELINRALWFYIGIFITFIPAVIEKCKGLVKWIIGIIIISVLAAYSLLSLLENQNGVIPYALFWQ